MTTTKKRTITPSMIGAIAAAILARGIPANASRGYKSFAENVIKRIARRANLRGDQLYPSSMNGGRRRKNAVRARRMNNAGHGNRWSRKHA